MKAGYKIEALGIGLFTSVFNWERRNKISFYRYTKITYTNEMTKENQYIGRWKPKNQ